MVRFLSLLTLLALPASSFAVHFTDVPAGAWFATHVESAASLGIVSGYTDAQGRLTGKFGPLDQVTIGQALKMAVESAEYDPSLFGSVESGAHWAQRYRNVLIATDSFLEQHGIDNLDRPATRAEVAQIVTDLFVFRGFPSIVDREYVDVYGEHPYGGGINAMTSLDIMVGDGRAVHCLSGICTKTTFRPEDPITRAEAVKVIMTARANIGTVGKGMTLAMITMEPDAYAEDPTITYEDDGFNPFFLTVKCGTEVNFVNHIDNDKNMWVASDPHPHHTNEPGFDSGEGLRPTGIHTQLFDGEDRDVSYHNHLNPQHRGVIRVRGC